MAADDTPFLRLLQQAAYLDVEDVAWMAGDLILDGRFEIQRRLGGGGMGVVFAALDTERHTRVALKTVRCMAPDLCAALIREFRMLCAIEHPSIVRPLELFEDDERRFFTMELVEGVALSSAAGDAARRLRLLADLADALCALHRAGHLHCDVKPSNVMVTPNERVVLLDFGIASEDGGPPSDLGVAGTSRYIAPERAVGEAASAAADWYSFGVMAREVCYERLTVSHPEDGSTTGQSLAFERELRDLLTQLTEPEPSARTKGEEVARRMRALAVGAACTPSSNAQG